MLAALRARQPGAPLWRVLWWHFLHLFCFYWVTSCYRYRAWGIQNIPPSGPILLVSNHQSFLDPVLVGLSGHQRQFFALARSTLFEHPIFSWLIRSMNAVPVERGTSDMAAMRKCIEMLQVGHALLVFPEGTRTLDGATNPFLSGTLLLVKRAKPTVVPVAIEGAFAVWPKGRVVPHATGRIGVMFGKPIPADQLMAMGSDAAMERLRQNVESMRLQVRKNMR